MKRLKKLCSLPGVSGDEKEVSDMLIKEYKKRDLEIIKDKLGSVFGKKAGASNLNVMISSNLDESGMMISDIKENGNLEFLVVGLYEKNDLNQEQVVLLGRRHEKSPGVVMKVDDEYVIDAGFKSAQDAKDSGVLIGNFVVVKSSYQTLANNKILSNNLSNRAGLELGLRLVDNVDSENLDFSLTVGGISHSVVGQRGAITATTTVKPDLAIVIDFAYEEAIEDDAVYIRSFDKTLLPSQLLKHKLYETADNIDLKPLAHMGNAGTDGSYIHKSLSGTPTIVVVVPLGYKKAIHNILSPELMDNTEKLLKEFLINLDQKEIKDMQYNRGNRYEK